MKNKEKKIVAMAEKLYIKRYCHWEFVTSVEDVYASWVHKEQAENCYNTAKSFYKNIKPLLEPKKKPQPIAPRETFS